MLIYAVDPIAKPERLSADPNERTKSLLQVVFFYLSFVTIITLTFFYVLQDGTFSDVEFQFPDGQAASIQAHRFLLMSKSPVFFRMFKSGMQESKEGKVIITSHGMFVRREGGGGK